MQRYTTQRRLPIIPRESHQESDQQWTKTTSQKLVSQKQSMSEKSALTKKHILFIGNPGVGKSTLLNCIMQRQRKSDEISFFKSGLSFGRGLTSELGEQIVCGINYMDTPGLQDVKMRKQAARSITNALKKGGKYKLVFVITLESGRVRPADMSCMQMVLNSTNNQADSYGVVINKLTNQTYKNLMENQAQGVLAQIKQINKISYNLHSLFLPNIESLDDENDAVVAIPDLINFLDEVPFVEINSKLVYDVPEDDTFERLSEQLENQLEQLRTNNETLEKEIVQNKKKYAAEIDKVKQNERNHYNEKITRFQNELKENTISKEVKKKGRMMMLILFLSLFVLIWLFYKNCLRL